MKEGAPFEIVSREGGLVANNLLLSVILGIVFVGTLYPLMAEALSGEKLSVGPPYFDSGRKPAGAGPRRADDDRPAAELAAGRSAPILPRLAPGCWWHRDLVGSFVSWRRDRLLPRLGLAIGAGLIPASLLPLFGRNRGARRSRSGDGASLIWGSRLRSLGMASDSAFTRRSWRPPGPARRSRSDPGWSSSAR